MVSGQPVTKTHTYVYDREDIILEIVDTTVNGGAPTTETIRYMHGPGVDEPLLIQKYGIAYYYHADGLGSIAALTDPQQNVVESYRYTAYGVTTKTGDIVNNPYRFTGREYDPEIGIYYYRARYYDPGVGRFITKDPIGFGGGVNLYGYVQGNPANAIDPFGLWTTQYNAGFHIPIIPGYSALGLNIGSQMVNPYSTSGYLEATPAVFEAVLGTVFDLGASAGIADLSGSGGKCTGETISFGFGKYAGFQVTLRKQFDTSRGILDPLRYIDAFSFGLGFGLSFPISYTVPLN